MYRPNLELIVDPIIKEIYTTILNNKTIQKHTIDYSYFNGCKEYFPINTYTDHVEVFVDSGKRNYYEKAIEKLINNNKNIFNDGKFCPSDGSVPSYITFTYSEQFLKRYENE